jgi:hypothetical protein
VLFRLRVQLYLSRQSQLLRAVSLERQDCREANADKGLRYVGVGIHEEHDVRRIILCSRGTARDMMFGVEGHTWSIPEL